MTEHVERTRQAVLRYFNAVDDYLAVFTQNASGALKAVGESFPFARGSRCLASFDNIIRSTEFENSRAKGVGGISRPRRDFAVHRMLLHPGAGEAAEGLTEDDMHAGYALKEGINLQSFLKLMQSRGLNKSAGALRSSLGIVSNFADVSRFVTFIAGFRNQTQMMIGDVTFDIDTCRVIRDGS